jgi:Arc/MetJ-type ribon-helix-helix transcriptional regulator
MQVRLRKPELAKFVTEKVKAGQYASAEAVVEDALARMMEEEQTLTDEDRAAVKIADEEFDRGEFIDFDTFAAKMREKYNVR